MSMLDLTRAELHKLEALTPKTNTLINSITEAITSPTVHPRMKAVVAVAQLTAFASQFKRNILLWDDSTTVPINSIAFVIKGSGYGGDSSVNSAKKCFKEGYKLIEAEREQIVKRKAIAAAKAAQEDLPETYEVYKSYMKPIPPIDIMVTTEPGLIQHINDIADLELSAGNLYTG